MFYKNYECIVEIEGELSDMVLGQEAESDKGVTYQQLVQVMRKVVEGRRTGIR